MGKSHEIFTWQGRGGPGGCVLDVARDWEFAGVQRNIGVVFWQVNQMVWCVPVWYAVLIRSP